MNDMKTIEIRIFSEKQAPSPDVDNEESNEKSKKRVDTKRIVKRALQTTATEAEYYYGKYINISEDYKTGRFIQNAKNIISTSVSLFNAAKAGLEGALIGGPVGAIIGVVSSITSMVYSNTKNYADQIENIHQNIYSNYFYSQRAGFVDGSSGTEN